jgi:hypothetical protein
MRKHLQLIIASSWRAVPICAALTVVTVCCFYLVENYSARGEPFACFDGTSAWPSIAIILFAALLSLHFVARTHFDLRNDAKKLAEEFALDKEFAPRSKVPAKTSFFGWEASPLKRGKTSAEDRIDIAILWQRYLCRGQFWMRTVRALPMTLFYMAALFYILPLIGQFPAPLIRGYFPFSALMRPTLFLFLFLTFFVIDAILLHEGFIKQLEEKESYWPRATFRKFRYPYPTNNETNHESELADFWDILLIAKRTEAVGGLIYYPFLILSLLIVARLNYFDNWVWTPALVVGLCLHFCLALYAAWRLPNVARGYRDTVLERLRRSRRQALMFSRNAPEAIDTMIEQVQSTHQGVFAYLWEQPAIRALLLPSSGIGLATLLQYLPH